MIRLFVALFCCLTAAGLLRAQTAPEVESGAGINGENEVAGIGRGFWKAELPGGTFLIAHRNISAVSTQEYVLDAAARVTEVNIMTTGVFQPRFYFIEPLALQNPLPAGQAAIDRAQAAVQNLTARVSSGDSVWAKVVKSYPTTTHAGTIEYRLESKEQLQDLFESLEKSWRTGRGVTFRTRGGGTTESGDPVDPAAPGTN